MVKIQHWKTIRWDGGLMPAHEGYSFHFEEIVAYYREKAKTEPTVPMHWYRLAEAQFKAEMLAEAVESITRGLRLLPVDSDYTRWKQLVKQLRSHVSKQTARLYPATVSTVGGIKWGYINDQGKWVISPQFQDAADFQENGLAVVQLDSKYGLIDRSGRLVVKPAYQSINSFSEGRAAVLDERGFWVMDEHGKILTTKPHDYIGTYHEGRALYGGNDSQGNYRYGYMDLQGSEVIPPQYVTGTDFANGKAVVQQKEQEYLLIGREGEVLQTYPYAFVGTFGDGLAAFQQNPNDRFGYLDEQGRIVISPRYTGAQPFEGGLAIVNAGTGFENHYGLIDKQGQAIIKPEYEDILRLGENRFAVGMAKNPREPFWGTNYAIADTTGRILSGFVYTQVEPYHLGLASATDGHRTFFIDKSGKIVQNLPIVPGSGTLAIMGNVIKAYVNQRVSYYDQNGTLIWSQNTVIPLSGPYRVKEETYQPNKDYLVYYPQIEGMTNKTAQERVNQRLKELSQVKPIARNAQLDYQYMGDFAVTFFRRRLVQLELNGYRYPFGAAHGMPTRIYAPVDLETGRIYRLQDLFLQNSGYVRILSDIIGQEIKTNPEYAYVNQESYKGIAPDQPFFIDQDKLYIYFTPYEIAPYAAGFPTFPIPFARIMSIIDGNGPFWKSFH